MSKPLPTECPPVKDRLKKDESTAVDKLVQDALNVDRKTLVRRRLRQSNLARPERNLTVERHCLKPYRQARLKRNLTPCSTYLSRLRLARRLSTYFPDAFHPILTGERHCFGRSKLEAENKTKKCKIFYVFFLFQSC